ncbi:C6 transcription factor [Pseudozyma hubeiensis]|nr:C6 transcription factor [Pseudozyma hubeiensis]
MAAHTSPARPKRDSNNDWTPQIPSWQPNDLDSIQSEALELLGKRKRRQRLRYSCTECHRRKHKCDREIPCGKCVERGVASSCVPFGDSGPDVHERTKQLETVLSRLLQASRPAIDDTVSRPGQSKFGPSTYLANEPTASTSFVPSINSASSSYPTSNARRSRSSTPRRKSNPAVTTAASLPFRAQIGSEVLEFSSSAQSYPPSAHYQRLVRQRILQQDEIHQLASALPSQDETAVLLGVFFRDINPLMFPFDEMWFREAFNSATDVIWGDQETAYDQDGPDHLSVITLLFAILALTSLSLPLSLGSEAHGASQAAFWNYQCRKCHVLADSIQSHDLFIVLSHIISARFLVLTRQAKDSWLSLGSAIREAQILGLHRLGPTPQPDAGESRIAIMRRTVWMHLVFEDCFLSLIVGQAPSIHDAFCDTAPPARLLSNHVNYMRFDLSLMLHIRHDMCRIVSKMLNLFFSDESDMTYEAVLDLDSQLQAFQHSLPVPYGINDFLKPPSAGHDDGAFRNIALHRFLLHISVSYLLVSLHLPYLRRGSAVSGFERSRQAAMQAAVSDHRARAELRENLEWPDHLARDSFVGGRFFYFHATSALGICLLSEPDLAKVQSLSPMLDEFLEYAKDHQRQQGVDPNRCIRQEIGIVNLIRGRVKLRLGSNDSTAMGNRTVPSALSTSSGNVVDNLRKDALLHGSARAAAEPASPAALSDPVHQPAHDQAAQTGHTRHPEIGEDMYEWWSWLVSSLTPSDLTLDATLSANTDPTE